MKYKILLGEKWIDWDAMAVVVVFDGERIESLARLAKKWGIK